MKKALRDIPARDRDQAADTLETIVGQLQVIMRDLRQPGDQTAERITGRLSRVRADIGTIMTKIGR
jgi:hypothetical protein